MEERYINMRRRRSEELEDDWDEPPRRTPPSRQAPSRKRPKARRNPAVSALMVCYKLLVVVSVLIVAGYAGFQLMVKPPAQTGTVPPVQAGNKTAPVVGGTSAVEPGPDTAEPVRQLRPGVYNILLAATDKGGAATDIMMVMCYDTVEQTVGVVSVPRDTITPRESGHPKLAYGKGGVEQRVIDISQMLGIPIDYYIKVNIKGFISLVDYLGGIDFYVPCDMDYDDPIQDLHIHYKEGMTHLNGQQAMEVARFRKNNPDENGRSTGYSDTGRTETQQKLLIALAKKVLSWNSLTKINGFVEIFNQSVDTDLSLNDMLYFASQAVNLDLSAAVSTATLPGRGDGVYRGYTWCFELDPEGTLEIVNQLINPYNEPLALDDLSLGKAKSYM